MSMKQQHQLLLDQLPFLWVSRMWGTWWWGTWGTSGRGNHATGGHLGHAGGQQLLIVLGD